ncbi:MAG: nuclear transport factor 2 family protein [Fulvimarina manganoxydans]|nr:nuclear transport factor 2 family protein [Fulvimarina manganoxydans]
MKLSPPLHAYFDADQRGNAEALLQAFNPGAVVRDEGKTHEGRPAIEAWWRAAKEEYQHVAEPLDCTEEAGRYHVRATVTGNFPGSPAVLTFAFQIEDERIEDLEIGV